MYCVKLILASSLESWTGGERRKTFPCDGDYLTILSMPGCKIVVVLIFSSAGGVLVERNIALGLGDGASFSFKDMKLKSGSKRRSGLGITSKIGNQQTLTYQTELSAKDVLVMGLAAKTWCCTLIIVELYA